MLGIFYSLLSGAASVGDLAAAQQAIDDMKAVGLAEERGDLHRSDQGLCECR